jgi:hypothetical protein
VVLATAVGAAAAPKSSVDTVATSYFLGDGPVKGAPVAQISHVGILASQDT